MIGIIGAMRMEVEGFLAAMTEKREEHSLGFTFTLGRLGGAECAVVQCSPGKVNAGFCAGVLLERYHPALVISTGVSGGIGEGVRIGDLVVATGCVQHDYDVTALGEEKAAVQIWDEHIRVLPVDEPASATLAKYAGDVYGGVHRGIIATGDVFVADPVKCEALRREFGAISCEMETAAIAQVCCAAGTKFAGIRAISDNANDSGKVDFLTFARTSAEKVTALLTAALPELERTAL